ncbi:sigma 54-interacting transcriptional regulator [Geomicrobium sp. JCM 19039]|uniref:sigma 54-interacting transcriptional regulator n=1 Tax=Geomicrobium sp. JCM 19039 TaxID=1460636 RepID=UPI00045F185E|nr:sigma 54-interacting transcriptional regulator [Geomicrobium sp. JCM 19039]GAK14361.1 sigma-54-dependent transcriptional activator [Geomicrobium sp. JCM 19039]
MEEIVISAPFQVTDEQIEMIEKQLSERPYRVTFICAENDWRDTLAHIPPTAKLIVSRGGLGAFLHEQTELPYVQIPITPYDLLREVAVATQEGDQTIVVLLYASLIEQTEAYTLSLNDRAVHVLRYHQKDELERMLDEHRGEFLIGDRRAVAAAGQKGLRATLLRSGHEALEQAIEQAVRTLEIQHRERAKRKELELIIGSMTQAVIVIDELEHIKTYNEHAVTLFPSLKKSNAYREVVRHEALQKQVETMEEKRKVVTVGGQQLIVTTVPTMSGAIQWFEAIQDVQQLELKIRKELYDKGLVAKHTFADVLTVNAELQQTIEEAKLFARSEGTVLIYGETGTGKELFAQSIHNASKRQHQPFVSVNCGALNEALLESELFGYEEGAFTGARKGGRSGLLELAHEGTLFLDEINEMSRSFQTKMLRVLQEQEVRRVGGERNIPINVRLICATNVPIADLIEEGEFKADFYYRIATLPLNISPLRDRKEDIAVLAEHFLHIEMRRENRQITLADSSVLEPLIAYPWYGNSRELQNWIRRLVITYPEQTLTRAGVEAFLERSTERTEEVTVRVSESYKQMEKELWQKLYAQFQGTKEEFCKTYGISLTTLWRRISE